MALNRSFALLLLHSIPLTGFTMIYLLILLLMHARGFPPLGLLEPMLLETSLNVFDDVHMCVKPRHRSIQYVCVQYQQV